jgi:hypothetical protein
MKQMIDDEKERQRLMAENEKEMRDQNTLIKEKNASEALNKVKSSLGKKQTYSIVDRNNINDIDYLISNVNNFPRGDLRYILSHIGNIQTKEKDMDILRNDVKSLLIYLLQLQPETEVIKLKNIVHNDLSPEDLKDRNDIYDTAITTMQNNPNYTPSTTIQPQTLEDAADFYEGWTPEVDSQGKEVVDSNGDVNYIIDYNIKDKLVHPTILLLLQTDILNIDTLKDIILNYFEHPKIRYAQIKKQIENETDLDQLLIQLKFLCLNGKSTTKIYNLNKKQAKHFEDTIKLIPPGTIKDFMIELYNDLKIVIDNVIPQTTGAGFKNQQKRKVLNKRPPLRSLRKKYK